MIIKLQTLKIIPILSFIIFAALSIYGQKTTIKTRNISNEVLAKKSVPRTGWSVPVFADDKAETSNGNLIIIEGIEIQRKFSKLSKEILISYETCNSKLDNKMVSNNKPEDFVVSHYSVFLVKGRVFGYRVPAGFVTAENGRILERFGLQSILNYIDEKGDGKFSLRCEGSLNLKTLPDWVKTLATN